MARHSLFVRTFNTHFERCIITFHCSCGFKTPLEKSFCLLPWNDMGAGLLQIEVSRHYPRKSPSISQAIVGDDVADSNADHEAEGGLM